MTGQADYIKEAKRIAARDLTIKGISNVNKDMPLMDLASQIINVPTQYSSVNQSKQFNVIYEEPLNKGDLITITNGVDLKIADNIDYYPSGTVYCINHSKDGRFCALLFDKSPYLIIYNIAKEAGNPSNKLLKMQNPQLLPLGTAYTNRCCFSNNGNYLCVLTNTAPYVYMYKYINQKFESIGSPTTFVSTCSSISWSKDDKYLIITSTNANRNIYIFKRDNDSFLLIEPLDIKPNGNLYNSCFHTGDKYLALGCSASPFIYIYKIDSYEDSFIKLPNPSVLPINQIFSVLFTQNKLFVGGTGTNNFKAYSINSNDIFTEIPFAAGALPPNRQIDMILDPYGNESLIYAISYHQYIYVYDVRQNPITQYTIEKNIQATTMSFFKDNFKLLYSSTTAPNLFLNMLDYRGFFNSESIDYYNKFQFPFPYNKVIKDAQSFRDGLYIMYYQTDGSYGYSKLTTVNNYTYYSVVGNGSYAGTPMACAVSSLGVSIISTSTPPYVYLEIYNEETEIFEFIGAVITPALPSYPTKISFSPDGKYLIFGFNTPPYMKMYKYTDKNFVPINPASSSVSPISFSWYSDSQRVLISLAQSPYAQLLKLTSIDNFSFVSTGEIGSQTVAGCHLAVFPNKKYIIAISASFFRNFISINDFWVEIEYFNKSLPMGIIYNILISEDNSLITVLASGYPYLYTYKLYDNKISFVNSGMGAPNLITNKIFALSNDEIVALVNNMPYLTSLKRNEKTAKRFNGDIQNPTVINGAAYIGIANETAKAGALKTATAFLE